MASSFPYNHEITNLSTCSPALPENARILSQPMETKPGEKHKKVLELKFQSNFKPPRNELSFVNFDTTYEKGYNCMETELMLKVRLFGILGIVHKNKICQEYNEKFSCLCTKLTPARFKDGEIQ